MSNNIKYRVNYYESEKGWGSDSWNTDYSSQAEAEEWVEKTNKLYCSSSQTPDYYIKATYVGEVIV